MSNLERKVRVHNARFVQETARKRDSVVNPRPIADVFLKGASVARTPHRGQSKRVLF